MIILLFILSFILKDFLLLLIIYKENKYISILLNILFLILLSGNNISLIIVNSIILVFLSYINNLSIKDFIEKRFFISFILFYFLMFLEFLMFDYSIKSLIIKMVISLIMNIIFIRLLSNKK